MDQATRTLLEQKLRETDLAASAPSADAGVLESRYARMKAEDEAIKTPIPLKPAETVPSYMYAPGISQESIAEEARLKAAGRPTIGQALGISGPPELSLAEKAGAGGVDFREGAPPKTRFVMGLAKDDTQRLRALQNGLKEHFGEQVDIRVGPDTEELEFYNPKIRRYQLVNAPTGEIGDLTSLGGDAMMVLPDLAATAAISFFTMNPFAGVTAGAVGAAAGDFMRLKIGQMFGVNEDKTDLELAEDAAKTGGMALGGGVVGTAALYLTKVVANFLKGRPIMQFTGPIDWEKSLTESAETLQIINRRNRDNQLRLTAGQASADPYLIALDSEFRGGSRSKGVTGAVSKYQTFDRAQGAALSEFFTIINQPYTDAMMGGGQYALGRAIKGVVDPTVAATKRSAEQAVKQKGEARDLTATMLPSRPAQAAGGPIREKLLMRQSAYRRWADTAAAKLDKVAGLAFEGIENKHTYVAAEKLVSEAKSGLIPLVGKGKTALVGERVSKVRTIPDEIKQLRDSFKESGIEIPPEDDVILNKLFDPKAKFSFSEAHQALSTLDRIQRLASKGLTAEEPHVGDIKFLERALAKDMAESLKGTPLGEAWDTFRTSVRKHKIQLDNDLVAEIIGTKKGIFGLPTEKIRDVVLNSSIEDAQNLNAILVKNPEAMTALRQGINNAYQEAVFDKATGEFSRRAHESFIRNYGEKIKTFFPHDQWDTLNRIGGLDNAVKLMEDRQSKIIDDLDKTFEGRISSLNPSKIFSDTWKPGSKIGPDLQDIRELKRILNSEPEFLEAYKAEVVNDLGRRIQTKVNGEGYLSATKLDSILGERGEAIGELFGQQYRENLSYLLRAIETVQRGSPTGAISGGNPATSAINWLARIYTGQFTTRGRAMTAANRINEGAANRVLLNAALDPEKMQMLMRLRVLQPETKEAVSILSQLGGLYLTGAGNNEPSKETVEEAR